jgi:uncharacterized membrane protein YfcA
MLEPDARAARPVGGRLGAQLARRISGDVLRVAIALIGLVVAAVLAWRAFG